MTGQNNVLDTMRVSLENAFNKDLAKRLSELLEPVKQNLFEKEPFNAFSVHQGSLYFLLPDTEGRVDLWVAKNLEAYPKVLVRQEDSDRLAGYDDVLELIKRRGRQRAREITTDLQAFSHGQNARELSKSDWQNMLLLASTK